METTKPRLDTFRGGQLPQQIRKVETSDFFDLSKEKREEILRVWADKNTSGKKADA